MRKITKTLAAGGLALGLALSGTAAYAYWTGGGSGTGHAQVASGPTAIKVGDAGGQSLAALVPGGPGAEIQTILVNNNPGKVKVGTLTATIAQTGDRTIDANPADYQISYVQNGNDVNGIAVNSVISGNAEFATPGKVVVTMLDRDVNQDTQKGKTVTLHYTLTAAPAGS